MNRRLYDMDGYSRGAGPIYSDNGRINLLLARCSIMCADHPAVRANTKIGVNNSVGIWQK